MRQACSSAVGMRMKMGRELTLPPSGLGFEQDQGSSPGLLGSWEERRSQAWSPPGSSFHGIFQARILEWFAISSSRVYF